MRRTGSHATRPVLAAKITTREAVSGPIASLKDERNRILKQLEGAQSGAVRQKLEYRLSVIKAEVKRLNHDATCTDTSDLLKRAIAQICTEQQLAEIRSLLSQWEQEAEL